MTRTSSQQDPLAAIEALRQSLQTQRPTTLEALDESTTQLEATLAAAREQRAEWARLRGAKLLDSTPEQLEADEQRDRALAVALERGEAIAQRLATQRQELQRRAVETEAKALVRKVRALVPEIVRGRDEIDVEQLALVTKLQAQVDRTREYHAALLRLQAIDPDRAATALEGVDVPTNAVAEEFYASSSPFSIKLRRVADDRPLWPR